LLGKRGAHLKHHQNLKDEFLTNLFYSVLS
jgi:hypothetical protein